MSINCLDQVSSRLVWYILIFTVILGIIGGVIFYTLKVRKDIKNRPSLDDDPNSIIGSNPEPKR